MAYESPLTIADVVKDISANKYVLPSIQREFVWNTSQIEKLFDSVMQDYPFGAFLFWELSKDQNTLYDFYSFLQNFHEKTARHNPKVNLTGNDNVMAVLDGQQRLTSIYIGLKGTYAYKMPFKQWKNNSAFPERKLYLNIVEQAKDETDKYEFSFLTAEEVKNDTDHYWFEVGKILDMTELGDIMNYLMQNIAFSGVYTQDQCIFANATLSQLFKVIHTQPSISYYKVKSEELDKVLQIFIRVNSGGTVLSYSDLLLSIATAQWESLDARKEITEFVDYINTIGSGFNVNKDFILKASLVLTGFSDIAFKVDNFNKQNMLKIEQNWQTIKTSITQAFLLVSSFGFSRDSLKSNPYGIIKANKGKNGIVSTLYAVYKPRPSVNSEFVQNYFEQDARMNNYMHPLVNKGAKNDMKVSAENALKGQVIFPNDAEQQALSEWFNRLDTLITLHQREPIIRILEVTSVKRNE